MKGTTAAKRYAGALLGLAYEMKTVEEVATDLRTVHASIAASHELKLFFHSPIIERAKKKDVANAIFKGKVSPFTLQFLLLLIGKAREALTDQIAIEFSALVDDMMGIVNAELRAPFEFDEKDSSKVREKLEKLTNKKVRVSFSMDKSLVGGFLAQVGDTVYDGSVRRQLELLKEQLSDNISNNS